MDPWYATVSPRPEVREGRSFNPDEFAIHLEQVVAKRAPADYRDPEKFFSRTYFTRALREHVGMVLRRLAGETANTAPVLTLVTQFGGGKTHTLTALYHLATAGPKAAAFEGVPALLQEAGLPAVPAARVAVFVGNAWDPQDGRETPWIDVARSLAGERGVGLLGTAAKTAPPGTETLARVFEAAGAPVLVLLDEVLNFVNRHRGFAEPFHAFLQNLTVAMTATTRGAAVVSLPRSQIEMTDWDLQWQERITKVVKRVAKDLFANDEAEIGEVVRRRLFEELGPESGRKKVARAYAEWCFERRSQLPPEWTIVDSGVTDAKARQLLEQRFLASYPFHPSTLSVFQRKWQALPQYQQTRGTLAMLAQWISRALVEGVQKGRRQPLVTLGDAPLDHPPLLNVVLGQLGESRLQAAIASDVAGPTSHARALDADTKGPLRDIHRRVGAAIFFESSGGMKERLAHEPELRFALGGPDLDTTSVDSAARALEARAFYIRRVGTDGYQITRRPTLKKVVADRRASLDPEGEVAPAMEKLIAGEFDQRRALPCQPFPKDATAVEDLPRLQVVIASPNDEWADGEPLRSRLAASIRQRGKSDRLYPAGILWCLKKPGRELRDRVEQLLAWRRVKSEVDSGAVGGDFDRSELAAIGAQLRDAEEAARDEVWASYRYLALLDRDEPDGLQVIDIGAGHASMGASLTDRIVAALKSGGLLSDSPGAGYLDRNWPEAFKASGAWPLSGIRQAFLTGALTRVLDPDAYLRSRIPGFVARGDFGLASGPQPDGGYQRIWFEEVPDPAEVAFEPGVFLLLGSRARELKGPAEPAMPSVKTEAVPPPPSVPPPPPVRGLTVVRLSGSVPAEAWNRIGMKVIPKLKSGGARPTLAIEFAVELPAEQARALSADLREILLDLGLEHQLFIDESRSVDQRPDGAA